MDTSRWFILPDGRLRAGWRLLLFLVFLVIASVLFQWAAGAFALRLRSSAEMLALSSVVFLGSAVGATAAAMNLLEGRPFWAVGFPPGKRALRQAAAGAAFGAALISTVTIAEGLLRAIRFERTGAPPSQALAVIATAAGIFVIAASSEELVFRGYAFQRILEGWNAPAAVLITSVAFGAVHEWNPHVTRLAVANTILAGVLLAMVYVRTQALWMPIALHFAWNWALALWGLPISGVELGKLPWDAVTAPEPRWLSGGDYGPEGSVVTTAVLLVAVFVLVMRGRAGEHSAPGRPSPRPPAGPGYSGD